MKKIGFLALTLVLTAGVLAACGCTNQNMDNTSMPTVLPTNEENWTTTATTVPTTPATTPTESSAANGGNQGSNGLTTAPTVDHGNGPLDNTTTETTRPSLSRNAGGPGSSGNSGLVGNAGSSRG